MSQRQVWYQTRHGGSVQAHDFGGYADAVAPDI